jgi:hypothetical protein
MIAVTAALATWFFGSLLKDEHRRLVCVVVSIATTRSDLLPSGTVSPGRHVGTTVQNVGGSAGVPSSCSSL